MSLIKRLFFGDAWEIGYRTVSAKTDIPGNGNIPEYHLIKSNESEWYADPFCIKHQGKHYIFFEKMKLWSGLGIISCAEIDEKNGLKITDVLEEKFHLSYPNVFFYNEQAYMIPESCRVKQMRLYKAVNFPYTWELDTVLFEGKEIVDTSIMKHDGQIFLFSYCRKHPEISPLIFKLDMENKSVSPIDKTVNACGNQCGGNILDISGKRLRPVQDSTIRYGGRLIINKITAFPTDGFKEEFFHNIEVNDVSFVNVNNRKYTGLHTINRYEDIEVVDVCYDKFYITKPIKRLVLALKALKGKRGN